MPETETCTPYWQTRDHFSQEGLGNSTLIGPISSPYLHTRVLGLLSIAVVK